MKIMNEYDIAKTTETLAKLAHFNSGNGLVVSPALAEVLKSNGIDGPYFVQQPLPTH